VVRLSSERRIEQTGRQTRIRRRIGRTLGDRVEDMAFAGGQLDAFSRRLEKFPSSGKQSASFFRILKRRWRPPSTPGRTSRKTARHLPNGALQLTRCYCPRAAASASRAPLAVCTTSLSYSPPPSRSARSVPATCSMFRSPVLAGTRVERAHGTNCPGVTPIAKRPPADHCGRPMRRRRLR
jgi:hypothetical protein